MTTRPPRPHRRISRILSAPRRWVRRRGFGIHSPFAFDFVRWVIACRHHYYCYDQLSRLARRSTLRASTLRLLFRLFLFFRPSTYAIAGPTPHGLPEAIAAASPTSIRLPLPAPTSGHGGSTSTAVTASEYARHDGHSQAIPQMLIINGPIDDTNICRVASAHGIIVILNLPAHRSSLSTAWASTPYGMLFSGSSTAIFVPRPHLPHQSFSLWL